MEPIKPDPNEPSAARSSEDIAADVYDFVQDFLADEGRGDVRPLAYYLARYPGAQSAVAAEFLSLTGDAEVPDPEPAGEGEAGEGSEERTLGRYVLERRLGQGGQGEVWLARDPSLQRRVALKVSSALFVTEEQRQRFRREAESIARLEHPGLAQIFEADVDASPPYIAMRYVEGVDMRTSLSREIERGPGAGVPALVPWVPQRRRDIVRVLRFFERCARALHAAHVGGVLHRDVKPGNVMVTPEGEPVLLDFGLARTSTEGADIELTREGDVFGTLAYMAPEQLRGDVGAVSARTDVYGLGATLFEALTGERPFAGASPGEVAVAIETGRRADARSLNSALGSGLGEDVGVVLETALEPAPERRYETALDLAEDLRRIAEFEPIRARPAGPLLRARRWARREPAWAAALGVTLLALVGGLVLSERNNRVMRDMLESVTRQAAENKRLLGENVARQALSGVPGLIKSAPAGALAFVLSAVDLKDDWRARSELVGPLLEVSLERRFALPAKRPRALVEEPSGTFLVGGPGPYFARFDPDGGSVPTVACAIEGDVRSAARGDDVVVVGTAAGEVVVLGAESLEERLRVACGRSAVLGLDIDAGQVVAASADGLVSFDARTGEVLGRFEEEGAALAEVAIVAAPVRRVVAAPRGFLGGRGGDGTRAFVLSLPDLRAPVAIAHGARIRALHVAEDAPIAATVDAEGRLRLIDVEHARILPIDGALSRAIEGVTPCMAVALNARATRVAVGLDRNAEMRARDSAVQGAMWEPSEVDPLPSLFVLGLELREGAARVAASPLRLDAGTRVSSVAFDPSGTRVAAGGWSTTLGVWDARTGERRAAHRDWNRPDTLRWSASGARIVSVGIAESVEVWRERPLPGAFWFDPIVTSVEGEASAELVFGAFVPGTDGERVVLCDAAGRAAVFHAPRTPSLAEGDTGAEGVGAGPRPSVPSERVLPGVVSPAPGGREALSGGRPFGSRVARLDGVPAGAALERGVRVAVAGEAPRVAWLAPDGALRVWDVGGESPSLLASIAIDGFGGLPGHLVLDSMGERVAALDAAGAVFEGPAQGPLRRLSVREAELILFHPDGQSLYVVDRDGRLTRASTERGTPHREFEPHGNGRPDRAFDVALSESSDEIVVAYGRNEIVGWSTETGAVVRSGGRPSPRRLLRFGASDTLISAGRGPGTLQVLRGAELPGPKDVPGGDVRSVDLSDDGQVAAIATVDGWVIVWDVVTGRPRLAPKLHPGGGRSVDLDGHGRAGRVLSVGARGAALWPLEVLPLARRIAPRVPNRYERGLLENAEEFLR